MWNVANSYQIRVCYLLWFSLCPNEKKTVGLGLVYPPLPLVSDVMRIRKKNELSFDFGF